MREKMHPSQGCAPAQIAGAVAEALESRRLLAGIAAGVLVAQGTAGNDVISIRRSGTDDVLVTTNGVNQTFDMDDFVGVRLEGFAGNDTFNMVNALVSPQVENTTVLGGAGSDTISYATRTAALDINVDPARGVVKSGAQTDEFLEVETIIAGSGNDNVEYGNFVEIPPDQQDQNFAFRVEGRGGNDTFFDVLTPTLDDNFAVITLLGGDGDDRFNDDENPSDRFFGDAGNDFFGLFENAGASGGSGIDTMSVFTWDDTVDMRGTPDIENLSHVGTGFINAITVIGNDLSNFIDLRQRGDPVTVQGLGGNDTIFGTDSEDSINGGTGNDSIAAGGAADTIDAGAGTDTVDGGTGIDVVTNAEVVPPPGTIGIVNGVLIADGQWGGDDITIGRVGADDVRVTVNDVVRTFDMDDFTGVRLRGFNGADIIEVAEPLVAGSVVRKVTLEGGNGDDVLRSPFEDSDEVMRGGAGHDVLIAGGGNDALFGDGGNDFLAGRGGNDFHDGGDGNDRIFARDNELDTVLGGAGTEDSATVDPIDQVSGVEEVEET
jgi:Ca2+-binding RTX toxin-like protein